MNQSSENRSQQQQLHHPETTNNNDDDDDDNNNDHATTTTTTPHPLLDENTTPPTNEQHSPEAAGAARGITRTIQSVTQRNVIGRLPVKKPPITITAPPRIVIPKTTTKPPPFRLARGRPVGATKGLTTTRRVGWRRGRVAKVSDNVSTGLDVLSTVADESSSTTTTTTTGDVNPWRERLKRSMVITGGFVKNTILGTFVYETYERTIAFLAPPPPPRHHYYYPNYHHFENNNDAFARASLSHHYLSGAAAGTVHSLFNDIVESLTSRSLGPFDSLRSFLVTACHHAVAHGVLFGSYESVKRMLIRGLTMSDWQVDYYGTSSSSSSGDEGHGKTIVSRLRRRLSEDDVVPAVHFGAVFIAGGSAGSLQHIVSHYTQLGMVDVVNKRVEATTTTTTGLVASRESLLRVLSRSFVTCPRPSIRATVVAFPTTAIGFVAFEYGKELAAATVA